MPSTAMKRLIAFTAAVCLVGVGLAAGASAQGFTEIDHPAGRFYGGFQDGVLVFTGGGVEEICTGVPEPTVSARLFERNDGSVDIKVDDEELPIVLYHSNLDAFVFIDQFCTAMFDNDPATVPPEPFATGTAALRERISSSPDGVDEIWNGVNGFATETDGTRWKVRTWADFSVDNGVLIGDPSEFQGVDLHQIGR